MIKLTQNECLKLNIIQPPVPNLERDVRVLQCALAIVECLKIEYSVLVVPIYSMYDVSINAKNG